MAKKDRQTICTVCYVVEFKKKMILLGHKRKRQNSKSLGVGKWNGHGGHWKDSETIEATVARELLEESGLIVHSMEKRGIALAKNEAKNTLIELHIFFVHDYDGELLLQTDEMINQWFTIDEIPYDQMWASDQILLPLFFAGKQVAGWFHYYDDNHLIWHKIEEVVLLPNSIEW